MSTSEGERRRRAARAGAALLTAALALSALTLLAPSSPSYDPFAWVVWGRELMPGAGGEPFALAGGPSWKPLPVLFTAPFALAGGAAPALWLLVARAGLLLALAGAFALGRRLGGTLAGVLAAVLVLLLGDVVSLAWRGASEPLMLACVLWAIERHLAGTRRTAFALGVAAALIRPEAVPFLACYAVRRWRAASPGERALIAGGLLLVPLLWVGVPALAGDPLAASTTAQTDVGTQTSPWTALERALALPVAGVWLLALACEELRPRDRVVRALVVASIAWVALIAAMTAAGYSGVARYAMPAAGVVSVLAAVAAPELLRRVPRVRRRRPAVAALALVCTLAGVGATVERGLVLDDQVRAGTRVAQANAELSAVIARAGGPARLRRCALEGGWVAANHTSASALAWKLRLPLDRVARTMSRPGLLVRAPRSAATGAPARIAVDRPLAVEPRAHAGRWDVLAVRSAGSPLPTVCGARKASGALRRIPNI